MKPTTWGAYLIKRFCRVRQQRELVGATQQRLIRANRSSPYLCQGPDSKWENLDQSSLFIFSIFCHMSVLDRAGVCPMSNIYHHHSSSRRHTSYIIFSLVYGAPEFRLRRSHMVDPETKIKASQQCLQHNILELYPNACMSLTSF